MYTVKRAIIMAAGKGRRMGVLTQGTPKPMLKVRGERMICRMIRFLLDNGIEEIYIVVGWQKERFQEVLNEFPQVRLIENPYYDTCNNISSLYAARDHLEDCMIIDGDQMIYNPEILSREFSLSGYNAVWCDGETNEWLMTVENGIVTSCSRTGGSKGWQLYSVSRWTAADGRKLKKHLEMEFEGGNRQIYWDDVAMFCHFNAYSLGIRQMEKSDIVEIDSIQELACIDHSYNKYLPNQTAASCRG